MDRIGVRRNARPVDAVNSAARSLFFAVTAFQRISSSFFVIAFFAFITSGHPPEFTSWRDTDKLSPPFWLSKATSVLPSTLPRAAPRHDTTSPVRSGLQNCLTHDVFSHQHTTAPGHTRGHRRARHTQRPKRRGVSSLQNSCT